MRADKRTETQALGELPVQISFQTEGNYISGIHPGKGVGDGRSAVNLQVRIAVLVGGHIQADRF